MNQMTKILIKIKIRDQKKFTKQFPGGEGAIFRGAFFLEPKKVLYSTESFIYLKESIIIKRKVLFL